MKNKNLLIGVALGISIALVLGAGTMSVMVNSTGLVKYPTSLLVKYPTATNEVANTQYVLDHQGSGTFSGNANQFVTIGGTTSVKSGASLTNIIHAGQLNLRFPSVSGNDDVLRFDFGDDSYIFSPVGGTNVVDLGAGGGSSFRNGYFSGDLTIGGSIDISGSLVFPDSGNYVNSTGIVSPSSDISLTATSGGINLTSSAGTKIGAIGTPIKTVISATAALDFGNLAAIGCEDLTIALTGANPGDVVLLGVPATSVVNGTATFTAFVSSSDTVTVRYCNLVSGNPSSGTFRVDVVQH